MALDQLIEYNMRNTFLERSYTKCLGEASARPFLIVVQVKVHQNISKLRCRSLAFTF